MLRITCRFTNDTCQGGNELEPRPQNEILVPFHPRHFYMGVPSGTVLYLHAPHVSTFSVVFLRLQYFWRSVCVRSTKRREQFALVGGITSCKSKICWKKSIKVRTKDCSDLPSQEPMTRSIQIYYIRDPQYAPSLAIFSRSMSLHFVVPLLSLD